MIKYYIIPKNVSYVQYIEEIETWTKTDKIDFNTPIVAVIEDSKATHYTKFVVIYKGLMQQQGGSGSCYNPIRPRLTDNLDPMDNSTMPPRMIKWRIYNPIFLLQMVASVKYELLEKIGYKNQLPYFTRNCKYYNTNIGLLIGLLDLIGMGKIPVNAIERENYSTKTLLLLN